MKKVNFYFILILIVLVPIISENPQQSFQEPCEDIKNNSRISKVMQATTWGYTVDGRVEDDDFDTDDDTIYLTVDFGWFDFTGSYTTVTVNIQYSEFDYWITAETLKESYYTIDNGNYTFEFMWRATLDGTYNVTFLIYIEDTCEVSEGETGPIYLVEYLDSATGIYYEYDAFEVRLSDDLQYIEIFCDFFYWDFEPSYVTFTVNVYWWDVNNDPDPAWVKVGALGESFDAAPWYDAYTTGGDGNHSFYIFFTAPETGDYYLTAGLYVEQTDDDVVITDNYPFGMFQYTGPDPSNSYFITYDTIDGDKNGADDTIMINFNVYFYDYSGTCHVSFYIDIFDEDGWVYEVTNYDNYASGDGFIQYNYTYVNTDNADLTEYTFDLLIDAWIGWEAPDDIVVLLDGIYVNYPYRHMEWDWDSIDTNYDVEDDTIEISVDISWYNFGGMWIDVVFDIDYQNSTTLEWTSIDQTGEGIFATNDGEWEFNLTWTAWYTGHYGVDISIYIDEYKESYLEFTCDLIKDQDTPPVTETSLITTNETSTTQSLTTTSTSVDSSTSVENASSSESDISSTSAIPAITSSINLFIVFLALIPLSMRVKKD